MLVPPWSSWMILLNLLILLAAPPPCDQVKTAADCPQAQCPQGARPEQCKVDDAVATQLKVDWQPKGQGVDKHGPMKAAMKGKKKKLAQPTPAKRGRHRLLPCLLGLAGAGATYYLRNDGLAKPGLGVLGTAVGGYLCWRGL